MGKPEVTTQTVFGKGERVPGPIRPFVMAGAIAVEAVKGLTSPDALNQAETKKKAASTEAKLRATKFSRFLRREFGDHIKQNRLMFRLTGQPYEMWLEAQAGEEGSMQVTEMSLNTISERGMASRFYAKAEEVKGNQHPTLGSRLTLAAVSLPSRQGRLSEGYHYPPDEETAMCRTLVTAMDRFETAYDRGEMEIYQLATEPAREQIYS